MAISALLGEYAIPAIIIAYIVFRLFMRVWNNRKGATYSVRAIFLMPIIYILLTAFLVIGVKPIWDLAVVAALVIGVFGGMQFGKRSEIFEKDGRVLYRRSVEVMAIWIVGFVIRIALDFFGGNPLFSSNNIVATLTSASYAAYVNGPIFIVADLILALSAGLLFGEAIILYRNYNLKYGNGKTKGKK